LLTKNKQIHFIAADQVVTCDGKILEKPLNIEEFRGFVKSYAVHPCRTVGSVVLTNTRTGTRVQGVDTATIYLKPIPEEVIEKLIQEGEIFYCAGIFHLNCKIAFLHFKLTNVLAAVHRGIDDREPTDPTIHRTN
jgi:predicted house-cleaning NTP pyrophosphatase (Maf/HAM1 superfamily)